MNYTPNYDLHNHTVFSDHANPDATVENLICRANALGLDFFGISEHVRFSEEAEAVENVKEKLVNRKKKSSSIILLGAEIDPDPVAMDGRFVSEVPALDYVILSIHRLPKSGIGVWLFHEMKYTPAEVARIASLWLEWLDACMENSNFHVLGHPLRVPIELGLFDLRSENVLIRVFEILRKLAVKNAAFEINNGFVNTIIKFGILDVYVQLVIELKRSGVKFSRGSDSHSAADVGKWDNGKLLADLSGLNENDWISPADQFLHK